MIEYIIFFLALCDVSLVGCSHKSKRFDPIGKKDHAKYKRSRIERYDHESSSYDHSSTEESKGESDIKHSSGFPAFIYDQYTQVRGEPKMLEISCASCETYLMSYQKDGPGSLLRCYLDRIHRPAELSWRQYDTFSVRKSPSLTCQTCEYTIGKPMIYRREDRPAYRMIPRRFRISSD